MLLVRDYRGVRETLGHTWVAGKVDLENTEEAVTRLSEQGKAIELALDLMLQITEIFQKKYPLHDVPFGASEVVTLLSDAFEKERKQVLLEACKALCLRCREGLAVQYHNGRAAHCVGGNLEPCYAMVILPLKGATP